MKVASEAVANGMSAGKGLMDFLADFISENGITRVIETGTYQGTGSTMSIIEGLTRHGKEFEFHSIEVNPGHYCQAERNVPKLMGVNLHLGLSIPKDKLPKSINFKGLPNNIYVDHKPEHREALYLAEVDYNVEDDLLGRILKDFEPELVLLDSAGHMGYEEYKYLMSKMKGKEFYLVLDDVIHAKHYKSAKEVKRKHEIIFETEDKFGGLCAKISAL